MPKITNAPQIGGIERVLLKIDEGSFGALYRATIGFATLPTMSFLLGDDSSDWMLVPYLLFLLLLLRAVPIVFRKLVPTSDALREAWAARRRLAKRYDSYQWRKLLWIGAGLTLYVAVAREFSAVNIAVCSVGLLAGAAGMARWHAVSSSGKPARPPVAKAESVA
jgi:hypothetical protein